MAAAQFYLVQGASNKIPVQLVTQKDLSGADTLRLVLSKGKGHKPDLEHEAPYNGSDTQLIIELDKEQSSLADGSYQMQVVLRNSATSEDVLLFPEKPGDALMIVTPVLG